MSKAHPVVLSYGGGLDSFTMLVESIRRREKPDVCAFVDVGDPEGKDPGEWPGTYRHIRDVAIPLAEKHGIEFVVIDSTAYPLRPNTPANSIYRLLLERNQLPTIDGFRICTIAGKTERFERWLNDHYPGQEVEVWIGFEAGEEKRAAGDPNAGTKKNQEPGVDRATRVNRFPLMEWKLCRCLSEKLVRAAGYPVPRKSACMFCAMGSKSDWQRLAKEQPGAFKAAELLESSKAITGPGKSLSIMGFRTVYKTVGGVKQKTGEYKAPRLAEFIRSADRPEPPETCSFCGQTPRATKATSSGWLDEESVPAELKKKVSLAKWSVKRRPAWVAEFEAPKLAKKQESFDRREARKIELALAQGFPEHVARAKVTDKDIVTYQLTLTQEQRKLFRESFKLMRSKAIGMPMGVAFEQAKAAAHAVKK